MNILITIFIVLAGIILLILLIALISKKGYNLQREIIINAPLQKVFDYLKHFKNWDSFNKRATADAEKYTEYKGTDGTVGFIIAWDGNKKVGKGEKEIMKIEEGKKVETEIRFIKPFALTGYTTMNTEPVSASQTKVIFRNASTLKYPLNFLLLIVEKGIAKDMDESLSLLKNILEE